MTATADSRPREVIFVLDRSGSMSGAPLDQAKRALSQLLDAGIPYCWNAGNHDYNETCWIGNEYTAFNPEVMATKPYWIDDIQDGKNTAVKFSVGDWN